MVRIEVGCDPCRADISADRTKLVVETGPLRISRADDSGEAVIDPRRECGEALVMRPCPTGRHLRGGPVRNCHPCLTLYSSSVCL